MIEQIITVYKVLEVREQKHSDIAPVVLICETVEQSPKRRRIEIRNHRVDEDLYNRVKMVVAGDVITVKEEVFSNVKYEDDRCMRKIDDILVGFKQEVI